MAQCRTVKKGDAFTWKGFTCTVTRVSRLQEWADVKIFDSRSAEPRWTKRQPLPLGVRFERVELS